jgi:hypothetical protein
MNGCSWSHGAGCGLADWNDGDGANAAAGKHKKLMDAAQCRKVVRQMTIHGVTLEKAFSKAGPVCGDAFGARVVNATSADAKAGQGQLMTRAIQREVLCRTKGEFKVVTISGQDAAFCEHRRTFSRRTS